jgi:hypothetical protein
MFTNLQRNADGSISYDDARRSLGMNVRTLFPGAINPTSAINAAIRAVAASASADAPGFVELLPGVFGIGGPGDAAKIVMASHVHLVCPYGRATLKYVGLPAPTGAAIANVGTAGATAYTYLIVAVDAAGKRSPVVAVSTATGHASLDGTNKNTITWTAPSGVGVVVDHYEVYRSVGGSTLGLLSEAVASATYTDSGVAGSGYGQLDTASNCLIDASATANTTLLNTTLSATKTRGLGSVTTTSTPTTGSLDGKYLIIEGAPDGAGGQNSTGDSDGASVTLAEVVKVASNSGATVTLAGLTLQHHAALNTIKGTTPVVNARVSGVRLDASGHSVACGIYGRSSVGLDVADVDAVGFSKSAVDLSRGARNFDVTVRDLGEVNGVVHCDSAAHGSVKITSSDVGLRTHAYGILRAKFWCKNRSTLVRLHDSEISRGCFGVIMWGGKDCSIENVHVRDMLPDAGYTAMVAHGELTASDRIGAFFSGSSAVVALSELSHNLVIDRFSGSDVQTTRADGTIRCAYLRGHNGMQIDEMYFRNLGATTANPYGVLIADSAGAIGTLGVQGYSYGLATESTAATFTIENYEYSGASASGANADVGIYLNHTDNGLRIRTATIANAASPVQLATSFAGYDFTIEMLKTTSWSAKAIVGFNASADAVVAGDVMEIDPAFYDNAIPRVLRNPATGAGQRCVIIASPAPTNVRCMISVPGMGRGNVYCDTAVVNAGDILVWSSGKRAKVNNSAAPQDIIGKAWTYKAAGSEGLVEYGPANGSSAPTVANSQVTAGPILAYHFSIPDAASTDYDITITEKIEVIDVLVQKRGGAGSAGATITVKSTAAVISDVIVTNDADVILSRALSIDDANSTIAAGGILRVSSADAGNSACLVTVFAIKRV